MKPSPPPDASESPHEPDSGSIRPSTHPHTPAPIHPHSPTPIHPRTLSQRLALWLLVFGGGLFLAAVVGVALGPSNIPLGMSARALLGRLPGLHSLSMGLPTETLTIIGEIRLPRVMLAGLVGAGLSVSGAALQGLLGNPLADPYVIGVSSGAAVGAALVMILGYGAALGGMAAPLAAFATALLAMLIVLALSRRGGRLPVQGFLLAGIVVGSFFWALVTLLLTLSGRDMQSVLYWLMGSFSGADWPRIGAAALLITGSGLGLLAFAKDLNLMATGEEPALHLGVNVEATKSAVVALAALATAASVAVSGVIAFVGLMVPHMARRIVGPDHRILLPVSALFGAAFLLLADTASRTAFGATEVPVGLITALMGGPFFFVILRRQIKG
ncbi:MAG: iron ABC transporter permease [Armatimonadetes bacterium]|nr:iron ABC transporter permease [Armatimonadota bacterium]